MKRLIIFAVLSLVAVGCFSKPISVSVEVVNEMGKLMEGANASIWFNQDRMRKPAIKHSGQTDTNGVFSAKQSGDGGVSITATKDGYYKWESRYAFFSHAKTGEMMPFDPSELSIKIVLKNVAS